MSAKCLGGCIALSWINLPPDMLILILGRLDITSSIRLSAVCTSWAAVLQPCLPVLPPCHPDRQIPWLLSAQNIETDPNCTDLTFYDITTATKYSVPLSVPIPFYYNHYRMCSNKGWLLTIDPQLQVHLINPLTDAHVLLPFDSSVKEFPKKLILCRTPDCTDGFLVLSLISKWHLVFAKTGDESWNPLTGDDRTYEDAIFHQGKVYAIATYALCCWDIQGSSFKYEIFYLVGIDRSSWWLSNHLVEWRGELLLLLKKKVPRTGSERTLVKLYKMDIRGRDCLLIPIKNLGDDALFVGASYSCAVSISVIENARGNCIYFTNDVWCPFRCMKIFNSKFAFGVFDLGEETFKPCCQTNLLVQRQQPIWFCPY